MTNETRTITDNLDELLAVLPSNLADTISPQDRDDLLEIVLDLGRKPEARFAGRFSYLREEPITKEELKYVETQIGAFGTDNRAGLPATLHRISAMRNRRGEVVGLTMRVGRAVIGIVDILRDIIESGQSLLLMGRPGLGKTTLLREMARVLADEVNKRVVIVDTSNEIAGDGDVPHPAIGRARRMQVARVAQQHDVMIEAVENHMPEVVVIDEIGRVEETLAARTIAERGVQLVATVHGNTLDNLLANPTMSDLIGGIQAVTLSDEEARRRGTQKTVLERKAPPTFDVVVEMIERDQIAVRRPVADVVDLLLRGASAPPELRWRDENGDVQIEQAAPSQEPVRAHDFEMRDPREMPRQRQGRGGREGGRDRYSHDRYGNERRGGRGERDTHSSRSDAYKSERPENRWGAKKDIGVGRTSSESSVASAIAQKYQAMAAGTLRTGGSSNGSSNGHANGHATSAGGTAVLEDRRSRTDIEDEFERDENESGEVSDEERATVRPQFYESAIDVAKVRTLYPFGISRSRLARAIKHLGLPLSVGRTWQDADAVLMLTGPAGVPVDSSLLRGPRDMGLTLIGVGGNTYGQIVSRLNELYSDHIGTGMTPKDLAMQEANSAAQRVLSEAEPVELRPQGKQMRRLQHQLAAKFHLRSYSVGHEPNRRVRFLPSLTR
jgi:stage III sporulation protein SpoIIIAA